MMYHMKTIVVHDGEIVLPKCMYTLKSRDITQEDDTNINISNQVIKFLKGSSKMTELEQRQDQLLQKLDNLYERIKTISSHCNSSQVVQTIKQKVPTPEEVVLVVSPDSLPWYINVILKQLPSSVNISSHIHSSVPNDKVIKINNFVKGLPTLKNDAKISMRLIFKCVSADAELKLSTLAAPILGNVNILRYLSCVYPDVIPYDSNDYQLDSLLDICHILERCLEKNKEALINKLFSNRKDWLYGNDFSIVDLAAYNVIKPWKSIPKSVNKSWFDKCEKLCV